MRIHLHIGMDHWVIARFQNCMADKRAQLLDKGVLFPRGPGPKNHTQLFMAVSDPENVDSLRFNRGFITADKQDSLRREVSEELLQAVATAGGAHTMVLSATQLGLSLASVTELERLRALLLPISDDIRILAHVDEQARILVRTYAAQVMDRRASPLTREMGLAGADDWWQAALDARTLSDPQAGVFPEVQDVPFWLDYTRLQTHWEDVFGAGTMAFRSIDRARIAGPDLTEEIRDCFGIDGSIGKAEAEAIPAEPSAAWLSRSRSLNDLLLRLLAKKDRILPRQLWRRFTGDIAVPGDPVAPGSLSTLSRAFAAANADLAGRHPGIASGALDPDSPLPDWTEADPTGGFRASQYLLANIFRIEAATADEHKARMADLAALESGPAAAPVATARPAAPEGLRETAAELMPPLAVEKFRSLQSGPFRPHNRIGRVNEEELAAAYPAAEPRVLPEGSTGNVIVGCMKNEAPYILEWVAYHRTVGVDNFLIYTNGCEDGTDEILDRLQEMGILQHRLNDDWKGNSPQQFALNRSLKEPVIRQAEWIIHIDVDEFMNIRCGNGTLADFFARVPDATNVAMTWRLFGHNGVTDLADELVIDQFDSCAPKYCPKPHTAWGFKTMFKNIGAYSKISCHRPNKLDEAFEDHVKWVNGSGQDMTHEVKKNGWRNSTKSIGYDLLQLNHYALRSAESFLIKRQRGRALHVDRSIGLNYWIRMDWCDFKDITIKRNVPRVRAEMDRLLADPVLRKWHDKGIAWHRAKADELHGMPEFEELYQQALKVKLTETERVAYALALDLES